MTYELGRSTTIMVFNWWKKVYNNNNTLLIMASSKEYLDGTNGMFQITEISKMWCFSWWHMEIPGRRGYFFGVACSLMYITAVRWPWGPIDSTENKKFTMRSTFVFDFNYHRISHSRIYWWNDKMLKKCKVAIDNSTVSRWKYTSEL